MVHITRGASACPFPLRLLVTACALVALSPLANAKDDYLPTIDVIGGTAADIAKIPGSAAVVNRETLERLQPQSTEDALKGVAGISIKPEEETAIVANIGVRGLSSADYYSLILEDGVPVAPGLFVGNGRYYNPRIQRMDSIEVLKGGASLRYGPSTIGGVINYKTKMPQDGVSVSGRVGSFGYREATLEAGGRSSSGDAAGGIFYTDARSDGFLGKGFHMRDLMLKGGMAMGDDQWVGVKFTRYENDANISYRGHFLNAFDAKADFNPAPDDHFLTARTSLDLNHEWAVNADTTLNTVVYWSEMNRDYWRYGTVSGTPTQTVNGITRWNFSDAVNGNNRAFKRLGAESRLNIAHDAFGMRNEAELGLRLMKEEMADQNIAATRATPRTGTLNTDRIDKATSVALFGQNRFIVSDKLALTPGLRVESYSQSRLDLRRTAAQGNSAKSRNTEYVPGLGFTYQAAPKAQLFGGVHKAFAPALNGDSLNGLQDQQLEAQRSTNFEIGVRGRDQQLSYEVTAFRMDFQNQIIPANSNSNFQVTNGGKTLHQGLEMAFGYAFKNGFSLDTNATFVPDAKFVGDRTNASGVVTTPSGNRLTYTPKWVANLALGYQSGPLKTALSLNHTGSQFTDVANTTALAENTSGFFTGKIGGYTTLNLTASYAMSNELVVFGGIKNLTDKRYISSLRQGIYIGPERSFEVGAKYTF
jgi:Fe(3+) dicitrate transport protein